jgi:hypothetical protein
MEAFSLHKQLKWISVLLAVLCVGLVGMLVWGIDKGFDLTDESCYLQCYSYPADSWPNVTFFHYLLAKLFSGLDPGVIFYRALRLALTLVSAFVFSIGLWRWMRASLSEVHGSFAMLFLFIMLGSLLSYSVFPQALSYNSLTLVLVQLAAGIMLYLLSIKGRLRTIHFFLVFIAGILAGLLFFVKSSSSVLLAGVMILMLFASLGFRQAGIGVFFILSGIGAGGAIYFSSVPDVQNWISNFKSVIFNLPGHSVSELLTIYWEDLLFTFEHSILSYIAVPVLFMLAFSLRNNWKSAGSLWRLMLMSALLVLAFLLWKKINGVELYKSGYTNGYRAGCLYFLLMFSLLCLSAVYLFRNRAGIGALSAAQRRAGASVLLFLLLLPLISAAGTSNYLSVQVVQYLYAWFGLVFFIMQAVLLPSGFRVLALGSVIFLAGLASYQAFYGYVVSPYRLPAGLGQQTVELKAGRSNLKLDQATAEFVTSTREVLKNAGFRQGENIIAFTEFSGIVYMVDGRSPGSPWYSTASPGSACFSIRSVIDDDLEGTFIFLDEGQAMPGELLSCMEEKIIFFMENYTLAGRVKLPSREKEMLIYAPGFRD